MVPHTLAWSELNEPNDIERIANYKKSLGLEKFRRHIFFMRRPDGA